MPKSAFVKTHDHDGAIESVVPLGCERPVSETLPIVVERIVRELRPGRIVLFGSYAEGTPTSHSDVDLLVVLDTDAPRKDRSWAVSRLLIPRPFPVDILVRTGHEVEQGLAEGDTCLCQIMTSGKVLYERRKRCSGVDRTCRRGLRAGTLGPTPQGTSHLRRLFPRLAVCREVLEGDPCGQGRGVRQGARLDTAE